MAMFIFKRTIITFSIVTFLYTVSPIVSADSFGGLVRGHISTDDQTALEGALIVLKHKSKGFTRSISTDANGNYVLRKLPIGNYTLEISKNGYQTHPEQDVYVQIGKAFVFDTLLYSSYSEIETISVVGYAISRIDTSSSSGGTIVDSEDLTLLPVDNGFENMALLAPGVSASPVFNASSIAGSSSAENSYYLNGLNVTSIRRGIGSFSLPWEAISQTEIKTGGFDPEFGGALGGIINAISKSGSNDLTYGGQFRIDPESLRSHHDNLETLTGEVTTNTKYDTSTFTEARIWASGAIIEDKLFVYGLFAPQRNDYDDRGTTTRSDGEVESDRWFAKIDWMINYDHIIEFTAMNFETEDSGLTFSYDVDTNVSGQEIGNFKTKSGGQLFGLKYTGHFTEDLSLDVIIGRTKEKDFNTATSPLPRVLDDRSGTLVTLSNHTTETITEGSYVRDQLRLDLSWLLGDHDLKFGVDSYVIDVDHFNTPNGIGSAQGLWAVETAGIDDRSGQVAGQDFIERRIRTSSTDSEVKSLAVYFQDQWQATDQLIFNLGVRYSNQSNSVTDGRNYIDVKGQFAPRLQAIYDLNGDRSSKLFATFGRYFQPVSANMNITQGSTQRETFNYYSLAELDSNGAPVLLADGSPSRGNELRSVFVRQEGIDEPGLIAASNIDGMYSDELTIGYQQELIDSNLVAGVRGIYRSLKRIIEDTDIKPILTKYLAANGIEDNIGQSSYYILSNPGEDFQMLFDFDGDGFLDNINIFADDMALPKPKRKYAAVEFTLDGNATDKLKINASYTWSHSWGNTEGLIKSDNGQADPGWTESYDFADLMDHGEGNLPNDRRHSLKFSGSYQLNEDFTLGIASRFNSGRPLNKLAVHPDGVDTCAPPSNWVDCVSQTYGPKSFYDADGNPSPRGSAGTTPWTKEIDVSLLYVTEMFDGNLSLKASVYNLLNADTATALQERHAAISGDQGSSVTNPEWGRTTERVGARYFSLTARYEF